ncbi:hypothetical protein K1719_032179 [Acacia pycnantha]|nr:hypothetical protein K1719_032179 [Acacia pycnantha]
MKSLGQGLALKTLLLFGFYMAWNIGANDVANAIGTSVGWGHGLSGWQVLQNSGLLLFPFALPFGEDFIPLLLLEFLWLRIIFCMLVLTFQIVARAGDKAIPLSQNQNQELQWKLAESGWMLGAWRNQLNPYSQVLVFESPCPC